jgi:imidazolonepropionase-like amidohydrolase
MRYCRAAFRALAVGVLTLLVGGWQSSLAQQNAKPGNTPAGLMGPGSMKVTPPRGPQVGGGPYDKLVIGGATVIDGTGAPPAGPLDIQISGGTITKISRSDLEHQPQGARVIDARGEFVTPGFISVHEHIGGEKVDYDASYAYKLWLGHGITAVKGVPFGPTPWSLEQARLSEENKIVAPRLIVCTAEGADGNNTPAQAKAWVEGLKKQGVNCIAELPTLDPEIEAAVLKTADEQHIWVESHLSQIRVARMTAVDAVKLGLDEVTHFYGIFESMLDQHSIQNWPLDYNYYDEYDRFSRVGRLWNQSASRGSDKWNEVLKVFLDHKTVLSPTMTIYLASRDPMAARNADWMSEYVLPSLWKYFEPNPKSHGSYFYHWTTEDEVAWRHFYTKWMSFLKDYNDAGGRIAVGADTSFIYQVFGFGYIQELKLLQEAGLTPFEILRSATLYGAEAIFAPEKPWGKPIEYGIVREGLKADLLVFTRNPLTDFSLIYGTGALRRDAKTGAVSRETILQYTIKDGIVYDSQKLLGEVRAMVAAAKEAAGPDVAKKMPYIPLEATQLAVPIREE